MSRVIEVIVSPTGETSIQTKGYQGSDCLQASKFLEKALGIVAADDATKAKAGRIAMIASRTNTVLSIPMLYCMVMQGAPLNIG